MTPILQEGGGKWNIPGGGEIYLGLGPPQADQSHVYSDKLDSQSSSNIGFNSDLGDDRNIQNTKFLYILW